MNPADLAAQALIFTSALRNMSNDPRVTMPDSAILQHTADFIDALAAATREPAAPAAPEGWKLVPSELTEAMQDAYYVNIARTGLPCTWQLMLAAAPPPSAQTAEPLQALVDDAQELGLGYAQPAEPKGSGE